MKLYNIRVTGTTEMTIEANSDTEAQELASDFLSGDITPEQEYQIKDDGHAGMLSNYEIDDIEEAE